MKKANKLPRQMWVNERIDVLNIQFTDHAVNGLIGGLVVGVEQCVGIAIQ